MYLLRANPHQDASAALGVDDVGNPTHGHLEGTVRIPPGRCRRPSTTKGEEVRLAQEVGDERGARRLVEFQRRPHLLMMPWFITATVSAILIVMAFLVVGDVDGDRTVWILLSSGASSVSGAAPLFVHDRRDGIALAPTPHVVADHRRAGSAFDSPRAGAR